MFKSFELGTNIEVPELPYPYNRSMSPFMQRFHWLMSRMAAEDRPHIMAIARKYASMDSLEGHEFLYAQPTQDPAYELAYFCVGTMTSKFRIAFQAILQGQDI